MVSFLGNFGSFPSFVHVLTGIKNLGSKGRISGRSSTGPTSSKWMSGRGTWKFPLHGIHRIPWDLGWI